MCARQGAQKKPPPGGGGFSWTWTRLLRGRDRKAAAVGGVGLEVLVDGQLAAPAGFHEGLELVDRLALPKAERARAVLARDVADDLVALG